ncbi:MAG TPA: YeeE/YedE thiosulfate transporter family protein [Polyangiaceae bacterium]
MHDFTPWSALTGGALIGLAASLLLVLRGRVAGISGIVAGLFLGPLGEAGWRALFVAGLLSAGGLAVWLAPERMGSSPRSLLMLAVAGLLVGLGTRLGNGCTSGHGVCGLSRLSVRSLIATATFMATGILMTLLARAVGGGS